MESKNFSKSLESGVAVSTYKKGDPNEPENFRTITLQLGLSKIFTSVIRNRLHQLVEKK